MALSVQALNLSSRKESLRRMVHISNMQYKQTLIPDPRILLPAPCRAHFNSPVYNQTLQSALAPTMALRHEFPRFIGDCDSVLSEVRSQHYVSLYVAWG